MTFETWFQAQNPSIPVTSALAVLRLTLEGGTIPFIARYRKEQTGNLDEVAIQTSISAKEKWDNLIHRQGFIIQEIEKQQKLTPELKEKILTTFESDLLEDLYLPYKVKRKSKATKAKEAGLEPLADWIWNCGHGTEAPLPGQTLSLWAFTFRNEAQGIPDAESAIQGAQDILIERLSETQELRQLVRKTSFEKGSLKTEKGEKAQNDSKFERYFQYQENVQNLLTPQNSHRYLAIRRGWLEGELRLNLVSSDESVSFEDELQKAFENAACTVTETAEQPFGAQVLLKAARLAYKAHVFPSIETEVHNALKAVADEAAIKVFSDNLRKLLLSSPFGSKSVLGVDPGIRTGCKLALVDDSGKFMADGLMRLQSEGDRTKSKKMLDELVKTGKIRAIAVGNGTAGRETEIFLRQALKELESDVPVVMVNEAGASVYSASDIAREEFPELDVTVRGAISIARRFQDPLAELVKIEPKSIGVGQYQHDVSQPALKRSLDLAVDSCVNMVGVNLNTASSHLLAHVSGIGPSLAKSIVEFRGNRGLFKSRQELLTIPRFSQKIFEQSAGFLRISDGENPLDNTGIHPERYTVLEQLAARAQKSVTDFLGSGVALLKEHAAWIKEQVGEFTFADMLKELEKPGRDPRSSFQIFSFRDDIHEVADLKPDMICPGIVTNVTNFGAFVDIGVHQDGLVHISQLSHEFVKDPNDMVSPGKHVQVKVLEVNVKKKQISLTMKLSEKSTASHAPSRERPKHDAPRMEVSKAPGKLPQPVAAGGKRPPVHPASRGAPQRQQKPGPEKFKNNPFAGLAGLIKK